MSNEPIREPVIPSSAEIFTLSDLAYRLTMRAQGQSNGPNSRASQLIVRAIQDAIRDLGAKHDWSYYHRTLRFATSPPVTGNYTLDFDGASGNPLVTLTGAEVWPSDAVYGEIVIGEINYKIFERIDDKNISLLPDQGVTANSSGSLTWRRIGYRLNREIAKVHYIRNLTTDRMVYTTSPNDRNELSYYRSAGGVTDRVSIQSVSGTYGMTDFVVWPAPLQKEIYELSVTVAPQVPLILEVSNTDGAFTSGSNVMTSASGLFTPWLVGCLVRVSYNSSIPSEMNSVMYEWRAFITEYTSPTSVKLSSPAPATASDRGYLISSPIDINSGTMLGYVESEAYAHYCRNHDHKGLKQAMEISRMDLISSIAQDNQFNRTRDVSFGHWLNKPFFDTYTESVFR